MADIRIKDLPTTATQTASDDFIALDGTVNGTRKIDASAPSFKTSVTSPSVVAPAATALTLTGGSTGASLVLGQGTTAGTATLTATGTGNLSLSGPVQINGASNSTSYKFTVKRATNFQLGVGLQNASSAISLEAFNDAVSANVPFAIYGAPLSLMGGNVLVGTFTDAANLSGGLIVNGSGAGSVATSAATGALRVTGGIGINGNGYFGGNLSAGTGSTGYVYLGSTFHYIRGGSGIKTIIAGSSNGVEIESNSNFNIPNTTSASSSTVGALTIGNGTAATNVAIGGGNVNAGGALVVGSESVNDSNTAIIKVVGAPTTLDPVLQSVVHISSNNAYNASPYASIKFGAKYTAAGAYAGMSGISGGKENATDGNYGSFLSFATRLNGGSMIERVRISSAGDTSITSSSASTGSTSGALQVAGGIYAGAASVFGSTLASGITTGGGGLTVTSTAENRVVLRSFQDAPVGILFQSNTQATGHYNWLVGSQQLTNQAFEIVPSTAINGTTFTTAAMRIDGATSAATFAGIIKPQQATTAGAPAYVKGAIYFDTTLNKLRVGGATAWETITSV